MTGGGVDVVVSRFVGTNISLEVAARAEKLLGESPLELLARGLRGGKRTERVVVRPDDVAEAPAELEAASVRPARS